MRLVLPLCALALLAAAAPAHAYTDACATTGDVAGGNVVDVSHLPRDAAGHAVTPADGVAHPQRSDHRFYATTQDSSVTFDGARYSVETHTIFQLGCSGEAGSSKLTDPTFSVLFGAATLHARKGRVEGIDGMDAAAYNFDAGAMDIRVARTPKGGGSFQDVLDSPARIDFGTMKLRQSGGGYAAVTPYIGTARRTNGQCHYARGAVVRSTGRLSSGATAGTVRWHGLASFSPR